MSWPVEPSIVQISFVDQRNATNRILLLQSFRMKMIPTDMDSSQGDSFYLIDEIRSNLSSKPNLARAQAWLLTYLSFYGNNYELLLEVYRLLREYRSYSFLSFLIEYLFQHHSNHLEQDRFFRDECQSIFKKTSDENEKLYSLLSSSARDLISSLLLRQWSNELEEYLSTAMTSIESLNKAREKARACLTLSPSVLQLILQTEEKSRPTTSFNSLRCLFVEDLLRLALENRSPWNISVHQCHRWLIQAMEFYVEYSIESYKKNPQTNLHLELEGTKEMYQCDQPLKRFDHLMQLAVECDENFQWKSYLTSSTVDRQQFVELRYLIDQHPSRPIRCPLECYLFCRLIPIFIQSIVRLSTVFDEFDFHPYVFLHSTRSIQKRLDRNPSDKLHLEVNEHFYHLFQCLNIFQEQQQSIQMYQEIIDKIHLSSSISIYSRLLKIFYFYYRLEQLKMKSNQPETKTIIIDDTPQSPPMQIETSSPLIVPELEQMKSDSSFECRLQLCYLQSIHCSSIEQCRTTINLCLDLLKNLQDQTSNSSLISISNDFCLTSRSYSICFDYLIDLLLQHVSPTLILLQIEHFDQPNYVYPSDLLTQISPSLIRLIFDRKLLNQSLKYVQKTTDVNRRWSNQISKRKHNEDDPRLTDEQMTEKILQHVSHLSQMNDEQRRTLISTYLIDERTNLHPKGNHHLH